MPFCPERGGEGVSWHWNVGLKMQGGEVQLCETFVSTVEGFLLLLECTKCSFVEMWKSDMFSSVDHAITMIREGLVSSHLDRKDIVVIDPSWLSSNLNCSTLNILEFFISVA